MLPAWGKKHLFFPNSNKNSIFYPPGACKIKLTVIFVAGNPLTLNRKMIKHRFILLACLSLFFLAPAALQARKKTENRWKLIWREDFKKSRLNPADWSKIPRGTVDWNNYMSYHDNCYDIKDGNLILWGLINDIDKQDTARYLTGGVYTKSKRTITYGKVEVRAKLDDARGAWPAIWMLPQYGNWPDGGEIDLMERLNSDTIAYQTVHSYYTHVLKLADTPPHGATGSIRPNDYNVYAVEIHPDSLVFSINDCRTFTYPRVKTDKKGQFPFGTPFYLLIDMQLEGKWVGEADPKDLPVAMKIDWVKFYEPKKK